MRTKLLFVVALALAIAAFQSLPAAAVGGSCGQCVGSYNSCMQSCYGDWDITPWEEEICGTLNAACWNRCQSMVYQMCSYSYSFYGCGQWFSGESWEVRAYASHYCGDYSAGGSTSNCF